MMGTTEDRAWKGLYSRQRLAAKMRPNKAMVLTVWTRHGRQRIASC